MCSFILQSVEEAECRRAYELATEVYMSSFDRTKPPEEVSSCMLFDFSGSRKLLYADLYFNCRLF